MLMVAIGQSVWPLRCNGQPYTNNGGDQAVWLSTLCLNHTNTTHRVSRQANMATVLSDNVATTCLHTSDQHPMSTVFIQFESKSACHIFTSQFSALNKISSPSFFPLFHSKLTIFPSEN